jgi:hypothetical protein
LFDFSGTVRGHNLEIENGKRDPDIGLLEMRSESFGVTGSAFLKGIWKMHDRLI